MNKKVILRFDDKDVANWPKEIEEAFVSCYSNPLPPHIYGPFNRIVSAEEFSIEDAKKLYEFAVFIYNQTMSSTPGCSEETQHVEHLFNIMKRFRMICQNTLNTP